MHPNEPPAAGSPRTCEAVQEAVDECLCLLLVDALLLQLLAQAICRAAVDDAVRHTLGTLPQRSSSTTSTCSTTWHMSCVMLGTSCMAMSC